MAEIGLVQELGVGGSVLVDVIVGVVDHRHDRVEVDDDDEEEDKTESEEGGQVVFPHLVQDEFLGEEQGEEQAESEGGHDIDPIGNIQLDEDEDDQEGEQAQAVLVELRLLGREEGDDKEDVQQDHGQEVQEEAVQGNAPEIAPDIVLCLIGQADGEKGGQEES